MKGCESTFVRIDQSLRTFIYFRCAVMFRGSMYSTYEMRHCKISVTELN
jgi:hypothetical protein